MIKASYLLQCAAAIRINRISVGVQAQASGNLSILDVAPQAHPSWDSPYAALSPKSGIAVPPHPRGKKSVVGE